MSAEQFVRIGEADVQQRRAWRRARLLIVDGFDVTGVDASSCVCVGTVDDEESLVAALDASTDGASLVVTGGACIEALVDDVERMGLSVVWPDDSEHDDSVVEWGSLLELLASGVSVSEAARTCFISTRSAYRLLGQARAALGVASNTAAVVAWRAKNTNA